MNALAYDWMEKQDYVQARQNFEQMVDDLDSGEASSMSHSDLERELEKRSRELMRQLLQEHLDKRGPGQCQEPVCGADRQQRPRKRTHVRDLETIFGKVQVERTGYGYPGTDSLHPLDAELNLPEDPYSLELRRRVAEEAAKSSYDETVESIANRTGANVGKRQVEELVGRAACDFDAFYLLREAEADETPSGSSLLVLSVDGKGVTMRTEHLNYDRYLAAGMPIATGVIEGACRHLVKDRMEITGARWGLTGAEAVLRLRALRSSGDFDAYWNFHEACEYRRNHQSRYAGGLVPETNSSRSSRKSPNLKRVK